jgi:EpsI family protein
MPVKLRQALLAAALLGTYALTHALEPVAPARHAPVSALPMTLAPWTGVTAPPLSAAVMRTLGADEYIRRWYRAGSGVASDRPEFVEMDVSYYAQPRVGATMHSPLNCLPGTGWTIARIETVALPGVRNARVRALTVERRNRRFAMVYWFQSGDRILAEEAATRVQLLGDALRRRPSDAGLVRVMAPVSATGSAHAAVLAFASRLVPDLTRVLSAG